MASAEPLSFDTLRLDGNTAVLGLIGDPIAQVKAAAPLTRLLQARGFNAVLVPMHVQAGDVQVVLDALHRVRNVAGLIITVPHKQSVAASIAEGTEMARLAQAVNVVRRTATGWFGDLLDGTGFVAGLRANGFEPQGARVGLAGAGGAGNAIAFALAQAGVASIDVLELDIARREQLIARLRAAGCDAAAWDGATPRSLVVNATPCGMQEGDPLPVQPSAIVAGATVGEVIMAPARTALLDLAERQGARIVPGRHMMEEQLEGMARFFGAEL